MYVLSSSLGPMIVIECCQLDNGYYSFQPADTKTENKKKM